MSDGGEGFIEGSCAGGQLHITLHTTKPVALSDVQWAANTQAAWGGDHTMHTCAGECTISGDGRQVDINVAGASGMMFYQQVNAGRDDDMASNFEVVCEMSE